MPKAIFASSFESDPADWIEPFKQAVPGLDIVNYHDTDTSTGAEIAITWVPPEDIFEREPNIKAVFNLGAGVDALLRLPGLDDDAQIVRLEDAGMSVQMAEYVTYALLRVSRELVHYEAHSRAGKWQTHDDIDRESWPVGVMGLGVIGTRVAQALAHFEYPVAGWSRSGKDIDGVEKFAGTENFDAFLARTRVLVNVLPLTPHTENILNADNMRKLMPNAYIINVGRGEHLVDADLMQLLQEGHIMGAMLDVFREEPLPADHMFWRDERIVKTPHIAAASLRKETIRQTAAKINAYLAGESISGVVTRGRGY